MTAEERPQYLVLIKRAAGRMCEANQSKTPSDPVPGFTQNRKVRKSPHNHRNYNYSSR